MLFSFTPISVISQEAVHEQRPFSIKSEDGGVLSHINFELTLESKSQMFCVYNTKKLDHLIVMKNYLNMKQSYFFDLSNGLQQKLLSVYKSAFLYAIILTIQQYKKSFLCYK